VIGVAVYYLLLGGEYSALDLVRLDALRASEVEAKEQAVLDVDSLRHIVGRLESDPVTIEQVARERFGMLRDGELLYRFVPIDDPTPDPVRIASTP
jgi:cell division protein FtsB